MEQHDGVLTWVRGVGCGPHSAHTVQCVAGRLTSAAATGSGPLSPWAALASTVACLVHMFCAGVVTNGLAQSQAAVTHASAVCVMTVCAGTATACCVEQLQASWCGAIVSSLLCSQLLV